MPRNLIGTEVLWRPMRARRPRESPHRPALSGLRHLATARGRELRQAADRRLLRPTALGQFVSAPRLHPPRITAADAPVRARSLARGLFLVATNLPNVAGADQAASGPGWSADPRLRACSRCGSCRWAPTWPRPTFSSRPTMASQCSRGGRARSTAAGATLTGEDVVVDQHYRRIATLRASRSVGDQRARHGHHVRPHDAWVTVYRYVRGQNLTRYPRVAVTGRFTTSGVQEYDLSTGKLLYTWDALESGPSPRASRCRTPRSGLTVQQLAPGTPTTSIPSSRSALASSWCRCATPGVSI